MSKTTPRRSERLTVRFRPHERVVLEDAAADLRITPSELIRAVSLQAARGIVEAARPALGVLRIVDSARGRRD